MAFFFFFFFILLSTKYKTILSATYFHIFSRIYLVISHVLAIILGTLEDTEVWDRVPVLKELRACLGVKKLGRETM